MSNPTTTYFPITGDVAVQVAGDMTVEADEGFKVTLSNPTNGWFIGTASADGLIRNDDAVAIETSGATRLDQVANAFSLHDGGGNGPSLKYAGANVVAGEYGRWTPIGAEKVGSGHKVAWKNGAADQYIVWNLDSNGGFTGYATGVVSGASYALQSLEPAFGQNLNGDATLGPVTVAIETFGATTLDQVANAFFLHDSGGNGPSLKYAGAEVAAGEYGGWTPIGAEHSGSGYQVAWKNGSANQYIVWNLDSNGSFTGYATGGVVSGASYALQSLEPAFGQNLNGDATLGPVTVAIETFGATTLAQVADSYFLYASGTTSGPQLKLDGSYVTPGLLGAWAPIGAEWMGDGYQVAWKMGSVDQYAVWSTDSSGNFLSQTAPAFGSSSALEAYEPGLHQDLNNDGLIGVPTPAFNIEVRYSGNSAYQPYFTQAAQIWQQIILGDLPGFNVSGYGFVDDLLITASVRTIDGQGGLLGQAGPEWYRTATGQPITAFMTFDSADLANMAGNGTLLPVILHETGHALGIGTMWAYDGLKSGFNYNGPHALLAYQILSGNPSATSVPLESGGGSATAGVHWSEAVFGNELMTGYISGVSNPLSILTVGTLQDMGYTVNYSAANAYGIPGHLMAAADGSLVYAGPAEPVTGPGSGNIDTPDVALFMDEHDHVHSWLFT